MTIRENIINEYAIKGYKAIDNAEAQILRLKVKQGMCKYNSRMEKNVATNANLYTETDDDIIFYNERKNSVLVANAKYNNNGYINNYTVWELH